jgi:hypothetical protein
MRDMAYVLAGTMCVTAADERTFLLIPHRPPQILARMMQYLKRKEVPYFQSLDFPQTRAVETYRQLESLFSCVPNLFCTVELAQGPVRSWKKAQLTPELAMERLAMAHVGPKESEEFGKQLRAARDESIEHYRRYPLPSSSAWMPAPRVEF